MYLYIYIYKFMMSCLYSPVPAGSKGGAGQSSGGDLASAAGLQAEERHQWDPAEIISEPGLLWV